VKVSKKYSLFAGAAVGVGAVLAFALPAGASVSVQSQSPASGTVKLGNNARLDANGAVVFPSVRITCQPGSFTTLTVAVTENVKGDIARGVRSQSIDCTGGVQKFDLAVTPTTKAFVKGVAFGQAELDVCTSDCRSYFDEHNVNIVKN
jgi:hypothetical protein